MFFAHRPPLNYYFITFNFLPQWKNFQNGLNCVESLANLNMTKSKHTNSIS